jgi:hypothetical protein
MDRATQYATLWDKKGLLRKRTNMMLNTFFGHLTNEEQAEINEIIEALSYQSEIEEREIEEERIRELANETGNEYRMERDDDTYDYDYDESESRTYQDESNMLRGLGDY